MHLVAVGPEFNEFLYFHIGAPRKIVLHFWLGRILFLFCDASILRAQILENFKINLHHLLLHLLRAQLFQNVLLPTSIQFDELPRIRDQRVINELALNQTFDVLVKSLFLPANEDGNADLGIIFLA